MSIPVCFPNMNEEQMHLMIQYLNALKDECKDVSECVRWINFVIADIKIRIKRLEGGENNGSCCNNVIR